MTPRRVLLFRTDRIGDVVLTLPVVDTLRTAWPECEITFVSRAYTRELVDGYPGIRRVIVADRNGEPRSTSDLLLEIGREFDAAIHVFPRPKQAWLTFRAGIPVRVGTAFRAYSFLFTHTVRDHRKHGDRHEAQYNVRLLTPLGIPEPAHVRPTLTPRASDVEIARAFLSSHGVGTDPYIVLHPGSGGSARDWKPEKFGQLGRRFIGAGYRVVVTGTQAEGALVDAVVTGAGTGAVNASGAFSLMPLAALASGATLFVSNSTGPLHIASAVGTPVVAFYPPIAHLGPKRWGPLAAASATIVPDRTQCPLCNGGECRGDRCMDMISAEAVAETAFRLIDETGRRSQ